MRFCWRHSSSALASARRRQVGILALNLAERARPACSPRAAAARGQARVGRTPGAHGHRALPRLRVVRADGETTAAWNWTDGTSGRAPAPDAGGARDVGDVPTRPPRRRIPRRPWTPACYRVASPKLEPPPRPRARRIVPPPRQLRVRRENPGARPRPSLRKTIYGAGGVRMHRFE